MEKVSVLQSLTAEFSLLCRFSHLFTWIGRWGSRWVATWGIVWTTIFLPKIPSNHIFHALYIHLLKLSLCLIFSSFPTHLFPYLYFLLPSNSYFHTTSFSKPFYTKNVFLQYSLRFPYVYIPFKNLWELLRENGKYFSRLPKITVCG